MPVTLAQAKNATQDDITAGVIDEFRKSSFLLENMTFDDAVAPAGGATLTYGYTRLITEAGAAFRDVNTEYTPSEATTQRYSADLKIFGGSFQIDRVLAKVNSLYSHVELQMQQKIKSARALFHDTVINGDSGVDSKSFDGLNKAITGTTTEYGTTAVIDLSSSNALDTNYKVFLDALEIFLSNLSEKPDFLASNSMAIARIKQVARRAGYFSQTEDAFGRKVDSYDGIPLIDLGNKPASNNPIVPYASRTVGTAQTGLADIYAAKLAMDGFHGVTLAGVPMVQTWLPDFTKAGAVKSGEVEMVAAVALKQSKAAGVFRNIKVQ